MLTITLSRNGTRHETKLYQNEISNNLCRYVLDPVPTVRTCRYIDDKIILVPSRCQTSAARTLARTYLAAQDIKGYSLVLERFDANNYPYRNSERPNDRRCSNRQESSRSIWSHLLASNVRLQARAARGASHCEPLFGAQASG